MWDLLGRGLGLGLGSGLGLGLGLELGLGLGLGLGVGVGGGGGFSCCAQFIASLGQPSRLVSWRACRAILS